MMSDLRTSQWHFLRLNQGLQQWRSQQKAHRVHRQPQQSRTESSLGKNESSKGKERKLPFCLYRREDGRKVFSSIHLMYRPGTGMEITAEQHVSSFSSCLTSNFRESQLSPFQVITHFHYHLSQCVSCTPWGSQDTFKRQSEARYRSSTSHWQFCLEAFKASSLTLVVKLTTTEPGSKENKCKKDFLSPAVSSSRSSRHLPAIKSKLQIAWKDHLDLLRRPGNLRPHLERWYFINFITIKVHPHCYQDFK